ncbi:MAG: hypothetical protein HC930_04795 [Hydrococcus sp. SU_1_0]|nr:hypothetical protein [Hydrococcus sp. SU_1_0]
MQSKIGKTKVINPVSGGSGAKTSNKATPQATPQNTAPSSLVTELKDLKVNFQDFKLQQTPLYNFQLEGGLILNGTVDEPKNIIPQGKLLLTKADVNLFSSSFNLARNRENTIVFDPQAGIFNPKVNVILGTSVEDVQTGEVNNLRLAESNSNEIDDPLSNNDDSQTVRINLVIDGQAQEILPNFSQASSLNCDIHPSNQPLVGNATDDTAHYTKAELNRFTQCFGDNFSLNTKANPGDVAAQRSLIDSSAIALTSTPSLNQGEIVNLLSNQFVGLAKDVSNSSQAELFDLGVQKFVVNPLLDRALYKVEDTTVSFGKKINLDYLTIYPDLEGIYEINADSSVRLIYSHNLFNKAVEAINSSGDEETSSSNEVRLEYQRKF